MNNVLFDEATLKNIVQEAVEQEREELAKNIGYLLCLDESPLIREGYNMCRDEIVLAIRLRNQNA